jgi:hypothetical protein
MKSFHGHELLRNPNIQLFGPILYRGKNIIVIHSKGVCVIATSTAQIHRILLCERLPVNVFEQIVTKVILFESVYSCGRVLWRDQSLRSFDKGLNGRSECVPPRSIGIYQSIKISSPENKLLNVDVVGGTHKRNIEQIRLLGNYHMCRCIYLHALVSFALFGGDHNDAVSSARTIQGRGGSILEHSDGLHVIGVDVIYISFVNKIIQHNHRVQWTFNGAQAPD